MKYEAVIFDLDGVVVTTDELHYMAWRQLADELDIEGFTKEDNIRQRGVSRMASLEVVLEKSDKKYSDKEKIEFADRKNNIYISSLSSLSPNDILPGVMDFVVFLKDKGIKTAIGSASKNTPMILKKIGLESMFDAVSCGLDTTKSKPDPEVFLIAAKKLGVDAKKCLVVEDSDAGIIAAKSAGMDALAVGVAKENKQADFCADSIEHFNYKNILTK